MAQEVNLKPKSNRFRQLIHDHGQPWVVIRTMTCACFGGQFGIEVKSQDGKHIRWVRATDVTLLDPTSVKMKLKNEV